MNEYPKSPWTRGNILFLVVVGVPATIFLLLSLAVTFWGGKP